MRAMRSLLAAALGGLTSILAAQTPAEAPPPPRIGVFFWHDSPNDVATFGGVRRGLEEAGVACEFVVRQADGDVLRASDCLDELAAARCRVVLALGTQATLLARDSALGAPVVFAAVTNPVSAGIASDWNGVGPGVAGASSWIDPHRVLEVFRLAVPGVHRLGMLRSLDDGVVSAAELREMRTVLAEPAAPAVEIVEAVARDADDLPRAVERLLAAGVDAIWVPIDITVYQHIPSIERAMAARPVPLLTTSATGVSAGAMVGASIDYRLHGRRAAALLLRVLAGADPGALPIDRMHSSVVAVDVAAARRARLDLPLSLLAVADELLAPEVQRGGR